MVEKIYKAITKNKKNTILFIAILALLSSIPLFISLGVKKGDDLYFHLSRINSICENLKNKKLFLGIYSEYFYGYGYANGLFYPDIFLYIPAILTLVGLNIITSYKIFIILINFFSILAIYISIKNISQSKYAGILGSIIYAFASYRLVDIYQRAALGEALAFIGIPLVICGIYEIVYGNYKKYYILIVGMTILILSHIISTFMAGMFLLIFCLINIKKLFKEKRIIYLLLAAIITLLLTSYFLIPMLEQMLSQTFYYKDTSNIANFQLSKRTSPIYLLFIEIPNFLNLLTNKYWVPSGIGIIFIYLIYQKIKHKEIKDKFINDCYIIGIIFLIASTSIIPWNMNIIKKTLYMIQFPWRFYFMATVLLTFGGALLIAKITSSTKLLRNTFIISMISLISITTIAFFSKNIKSIDTYDASFAEYLPIEIDKDYIEKRKTVITSNNNTIHEFIKKGTDMEITFKQNNNNTELELPLIYYKGYEAKINKKNIDTYKTSNGLLGLKINNIKEGTIKVTYQGTKLSNITKKISLITLITLIIFSIYKLEVKHEK